MNFTRPSIFAKSVSSLPRPTLRPGFSFVPRCRTMIEPPVTVCPAKIFTPSRCALESRPFFELPSPFLCAIAVFLRSAQRGRKIPRLRGVAVAVHLDLADLHLGERLAVALQLLVLLLPLEVEDQHLVAAAFADDGAEHLRRLRLHQRPAVARKGENVGELHRAVFGWGNRLHLHYVAGSNPVLLATCANHRVHKTSGAPKTHPKNPGSALHLIVAGRNS